MKLEKYLIEESIILEAVNFKEQLDDIGGQEGLKEWLDNKSKIFKKIEEAKKHGVDIPRGVLLFGMPGCGKSLAAKACARLFEAPLIKLDIGRLLGKYVEESEQNIIEAVKIVESLSPCILWVDEIEKAFAGKEQDEISVDITKILLGQFMTRLQEKENSVFIVATANDITNLPSELLGKDRFDEVFFIDFPNEEERERIFEIHLEKRGKNTENIDLEMIAKETKGYCGADIEEIVKFTIEDAFIHSHEVTTEDLMRSKGEIDSLASILKDKIETQKSGFEKFKIKSATKKLNRVRKKTIKLSSDEDYEKDMIKVKGGKYKPSFYAEERAVADLWIDKYQVTQKEWQDLMDSKPSHFKGPKKPVERVSWIDALEFCNKMSEKHGLHPVYKIEKGVLVKVIHSDGEEVYPNLADFRKTEGYRLPTELEWEWVARGAERAVQNGTFKYRYSGADNINEVAWCSENSGNQTHDVGGKEPNQLGLYDMTGNVWEWCYDSTAEGFISADKPYVYDENEGGRRLKGGSWGTITGYAEVTDRESYDLAFKYNDVGFRICRTV